MNLREYNRSYDIKSPYSKQEYPHDNKSNQNFSFNFKVRTFIKLNLITAKNYSKKS